MNPHRRRAACALLLLLSSCSGSSSGLADGSKGQQDISDVIYVGGVTDEALVRLLDVPAKNDARKAVTVDSPDLTTPLSKDSPATLQFHLASAALRAPGLRQGPAQRQPSKWQRSFHEFLQFVAPERTAHAHGTPYNGTAYYLVISDATSKQKLQVFTTATSFTPESVDWQHLAAAPQPLTLEITSGLFRRERYPRRWRAVCRRYIPVSHRVTPARAV